MLQTVKGVNSLKFLIPKIKLIMYFHVLFYYLTSSFFDNIVDTVVVKVDDIPMHIVCNSIVT